MGQGIKNSKVIRSNTGSSTCEMPVVLFVFMFGLLLPLADLSFIAFRTSFVHAAAQNALHSAVRAKTFQQNANDGELSAVNIGRRDAISVRDNGITGVNFEDKDVNIAILGTPVKAGKNPIHSSAPLSNVESKSYLYQVEVTVTGRVEPLITLSSTLFGDVPGLTSALPVQATYKQFVEHPEGLAM